MINGGSSFKTKSVFTDVNAEAIFSITATLTDLMKLSTRRRRSYIMLPNQLTVNQKDLPPTKKRASRMLGGLHHNLKVRKTPQPTLIY